MLKGTAGSWGKAGVEERGDSRSVWDRQDQGRRTGARLTKIAPDRVERRVQGSSTSCVPRRGMGWGCWHSPGGGGVSMVGLVPRGQMKRAVSSQPGKATEGPSQAQSQAGSKQKWVAAEGDLAGRAVSHQGSQGRNAGSNACSQRHQEGAEGTGSWLGQW